MVPLIRFQREHDSIPQADNKEKAANVLLFPLHILFGKIRVIHTDSSPTDLYYTQTAKIIVGIASVVLFPITILSTGIGMIVMACSSSYKLASSYQHSSPPEDQGDHFLEEPIGEVQPAVEVIHHCEFTPLIALAKEFDRQIQELSEGRCRLLEDNHEPQPTTIVGYHPFKFDVEKWEMSSLDPKARSCPDRIRECRQDLVEALAEFNVSPRAILHPSYEVKPSEYLQDQKWIDQLTVPEGFPSDILEEAKNTLKGDLYIGVSPALGEPTKTMIPNLFFGIIDGSSLGPYVSISKINAESKEWTTDKYARCPNTGFGSNFAHYDFLIGKREGDFVFYHCENGQQIMFRLRQRRHRPNDGRDFEEQLVINIKPEYSYDNADQKEVRQSVFEQLREEYGDDLIRRCHASNTSAATTSSTLPSKL